MQVASAQQYTETNQLVISENAAQTERRTSQSSALYETARNSYLNNDFGEAITLFEQYIREFPQGAEVCLSNYSLGEMYYVLGDFQKAVDYFHAVVRIRQNNVPEALFFLGRSYESLNNYERALENFRMLTRDYPNHQLSRTASEHIRELRDHN